MNMKVLLAVVVFTIYFGCSSVSGKRVSVYVNNMVAPDTMLDIHCKSKNDDLGLHKIAYRQNQTWSFKINFWGTTLFWCGMGWHDKDPRGFNPGGYIHGSFEIYNYKRDSKKCDGICVWNVQNYGIYFVNKDTKKNEFMFSWQPASTNAKETDL
ncbi:hypothetical protein AQUCO_00200209v1 [Aquilegia coerulea]|uniref:S-protein homolog n=1 Tax=Aquilegia coerulea TaxID=218851 RepID=A0A2G5F270_AQUCA|nr:hypothetical protein AQUCO_00200209v1 [Aquilegia coerulea]